MNTCITYSNSFYILKGHSQNVFTDVLMHLKQNLTIHSQKILLLYLHGWTGKKLRREASTPQSALGPFSSRSSCNKVFLPLTCMSASSHGNPRTWGGASGCTSVFLILDGMRLRCVLYLMLETHNKNIMKCFTGHTGCLLTQRKDRTKPFSLSLFFLNTFSLNAMI